MSRSILGNALRISDSVIKPRWRPFSIKRKMASSLIPAPRRVLGEKRFAFFSFFFLAFLELAGRRRKLRDERRETFLVFLLFRFFDFIFKSFESS